MRLLFVCTGNTCRSPMAASLAQTEVANRGLTYIVESAGLYTADGLPMSPQARQALTRRRIPLPPHQSTVVNGEIVNRADIILGMTEQHTRELARRFPDAARKIRTLGSYLEENGTHSGDSCDIVDPFGQSDEAYERAAEQIHKAIAALLTELSSGGGQAE